MERVAAVGATTLGAAAFAGAPVASANPSAPPLGDVRYRSRSPPSSSSRWREHTATRKCTRLASPNAAHILLGALAPPSIDERNPA